MVLDLKTRPWTWTFAVLLASQAVFTLGMVRDVNIYDESIILVGAMRWLAGDVPHRDFYSNYGPGQYAIVGTLLRLFGPDLLIVRLYAVFSMAAVVALSFRLLVTTVGTAFCLLGTALCAAFIFSSPQYLYPVYQVGVLALLGSLALLTGDRPIGPRRAALAGACAGLAALFRYDSGFFMLVAHCLSILILSDGRSIADRIRAAIPGVLAYGLAAGGVFAPFAAAYLVVAPVQPFLHDIVEFPLTYYGRMRGLPFPDLATLIDQPPSLGVYFPLAAIVLLLANSRLRPSPQAPDSHERTRRALFVMMTTLTAILYYKGIVRVSTVHMLISIIPATLLTALALEGLWRRGQRWWVMALVPAVFLAPAAAAGRELRDDVFDGRRSLIGAMLLPRAVGEQCADALGFAPVRLDPKYAAVASFIRKNSTASERIFVGLDRHDKTFANAIGVYFAADRLPGTRWHHFDPGLQNRLDIQKQIIADLIGSQVRWVLRDASFSAIAEPNDSRISSGVRLLDQYLAHNFRPVARSEDVVVWLRRDAPLRLDFASKGCLLQPVHRGSMGEE